MIKSVIRRFALPAITVAGLAAGGLALAGPASAAPLPALHPQTFFIEIGTSGHGFATAHGPVAGEFAYQGTSATTAVLANEQGAVDVTHTNGGGNVNLDPRSCTGFVFQQGAWWLRGISGRDAHAVGFGHFDAWTWVQAPRVRGRCDAGRARTETIVWAWGQSANPRIIIVRPPAPKPVTPTPAPAHTQYPVTT
jgi:hypothetical protein